MSWLMNALGVLTSLAGPNERLDKLKRQPYESLYGSLYGSKY